MKKPYGPCLNCLDRVAENPEKGVRDCHITCERYAEYKKAVADYKKDRSMIRHADYDAGRPWLKPYVRYKKESR